MSPPSSNNDLPILTTNKSLAVPAPGKQPSFEEVAGIAIASAMVCNQSVCVLCLTQQLLERWMQELEELAVPITLLDVVNTNRATLADWKELLSGNAYNVTVLHGTYRELRANRLSVGYVKALVDAVSSGLVIVA